LDAAVEPGAGPEGFGGWNRSGTGAARSPRSEGVAEALEAYAARHARGYPDAEASPGVEARRLLNFDGGAAGSSRVISELGETRGELEVSDGRLGRLRYLGAFDATYLLFEDLDRRELVVLDQHAAHERILYEALLEGARGKPADQPLLFPSTLECSPAEMAAFGERAEDLEALGFVVEPFGPSTLVLRSAPAVVSPGAAESAVRDLLGADDIPGTGTERWERVEVSARRAACSAAVKARAALVSSEVRELLRRLEGLRNPTHCPHGRPLLARLSVKDLEGLFHRK
jgi:DNA mismatch repair protein MutL